MKFVRLSLLMIELLVWFYVSVNDARPAKSYVATFPTGTNTCDRPAVSITLENCDGLMEREEKHTCQEEEVRAEEKLQASCSSEVSHTVLKLSFSEDQSFSGVHSSGELNAPGLPTGDEQSLSEVPRPDESGVMETGGGGAESVQDACEAASCENITPCFCSEDEIEPSTDEELRLWQYPQGQVWEEEEEELRLEGGRTDGGVEGEADLESTRAENHKESDPHQAGEGCVVGSSFTEATVSSEAQEEDTPVDERSRSAHPAAFSADQSGDELLGGAGAVAVAQGLKVPERCVRSPDTSQPQSESSPLRVGEDLSVSGVSARDDQQQEEEEVEQGDSGVEVQLGGETQSEVQGSSPRCEGDPLNEEQVEESVKVQGGESSKKVTFVLEPELIGDDTYSSGEKRST